MGMRETASRIIKRFGQAGYLRSTINSGPEWSPVQVDVDAPITVAVVRYSQEVMAGSLVAAGDLRALVSVEGLDAAPTTADRLVVAGKVFVIVEVAPLAPDGVARFYDLQVRR